MSNTPYTIYRRAAVKIAGRLVHEIVRSGHCPEYVLGSQVGHGESILVGQALCDVQHYIEHDAEGRKSSGKYAPEIIARRAPHGWRPPIDAAVPALVAKGINPALARRLAQRRSDRASQGSQGPKKPA